MCKLLVYLSHPLYVEISALMPPRRRKPPRAGALTELPPLKIIRSIVLLQLAYYVTAIVLILFTALVAGQKFSLNLIFDWKSIRGDNTIGWTLGLVWLLVGFIKYTLLELLQVHETLIKFLIVSYLSYSLSRAQSSSLILHLLYTSSISSPHRFIPALFL